MAYGVTDDAISEKLYQHGVLTIKCRKLQTVK